MTTSALRSLTDKTEILSNALIRQYPEMPHYINQDNSLVPTPQGIREIIHHLQNKDIIHSLQLSILVFEDREDFFFEIEKLQDNQALVGIIYLNHHYTTCEAYRTNDQLIFLQSDSVGKESFGQYLENLSKSIRLIFYQARILQYSPQRQRDRNFCWIFAIRDAIYFSRIGTLPVNIETYPPILMRGSQFVDQFDEYKNQLQLQDREALNRSLNKNILGSKNAYALYRAIKYLGVIFNRVLNPEENPFLLLHSHYSTDPSTVMSILKSYADNKKIIEILIDLPNVQEIIAHTQEFISSLPLTQLYYYSILYEVFPKERFYEILDTAPIEYFCTVLKNIPLNLAYVNSHNHIFNRNQAFRPEAPEFRPEYLLQIEETLATRAENLEDIEGINLLSVFKYILNSYPSWQPGNRLFMAAKYGYPHMIKSLLIEDIDPNVRDENGLTPLDYAKQSGNAEIVNAFNPVDDLNGEKICQQ